MHDFFQILHEQYYTNGTWQTRECYPWEYDVKIQELLAKKSSYFTTEDDCKWFRQQAQIFQDRANYIRQAWAKQQAIQLASQQANQRLATLHATLQAALQATQHSTPPTLPAPQEAQKEEDEQPLYQATMEDIAESTTEKETEQQDGSTKPDNKSTVSTIPRLRTAPASRDPAACLSIALFAYRYTAFLAWHGLLPGYIEHSEGMEATGQG